MEVCFIIGNNFDLESYDFTNKIVVGVDKGAFLAYQSKIKLDYAVGDFDSISAQELKLLEGYTKIVKLNPIKDETDTLCALRMFKDANKLIILGGIMGTRIDHFIANIKLFYEFNNLILIDNNTMIMECSNDMDFSKDEYKFYSFFALEDAFDLSLEGFKYPLNNFLLKKESLLGVSNELLENGHLSFSKGKLLLIKTKGE